MTRARRIWLLTAALSLAGFVVSSATNRPLADPAFELKINDTVVALTRRPSIVPQFRELPGPCRSLGAFLESVTFVPEEDLFVVDGDVPVEDMQGLLAHMSRLCTTGTYSGRSLDSLFDILSAGGEQKLIVKSKDGVITTWPHATRRNLTYCVSPKFNERRIRVSEAMRTASESWESAAGIDFVELSSTTCTDHPDSALFLVRPMAFTSMVALAFFPDSRPAKRFIRLSNSAFELQADLSLAGILRHELGHVLGFYHEHIRPEGAHRPGCSESRKEYVEKTPYDPASVMHYPGCHSNCYPRCTGPDDAIPDPTLSMLDLDAVGRLYGAAGT